MTACLPDPRPLPHLSQLQDVEVDSSGIVLCRCRSHPENDVEDAREKLHNNLARVSVSVAGSRCGLWLNRLSKHTGPVHCLDIQEILPDNNQKRFDDFLVNGHEKRIKTNLTFSNKSSMIS